MVVVVPGCLTTQDVRAIRLTRLMRFELARWRTALGFAFAFECLMIAGRSGGFAETWTAPPPMTAPPQVQAHNFAKAIFTDITLTLFQALDAPPDSRRLVSESSTGLAPQMQRIPLGASALTTMWPANARQTAVPRTSVPFMDRPVRWVNESSGCRRSDYG